MTTETNARRDDEIEKELLAFLAERTGRTWHVDFDLFASGGVTSLFALELVLHVEQTYGVSVRGADLKLDNFRTVSAMTAMIQRLCGSTP
jgi:methoxymalonate biosynthesis acyl carrier protein